MRTINEQREAILQAALWGNKIYDSERRKNPDKASEVASTIETLYDAADTFRGLISFLEMYIRGADDRERS